MGSHRTSLGSRLKEDICYEAVRAGIKSIGTLGIGLTSSTLKRKVFKYRLMSVTTVPWIFKAGKACGLEQSKFSLNVILLSSVAA